MEWILTELYVHVAEHRPFLLQLWLNSGLVPPHASRWQYCHINLLNQTAAQAHNNNNNKKNLNSLQPQ